MLYDVIYDLYPECKRDDNANESEWDWFEINRQFHEQRYNMNISAQERSRDAIKQRWRNSVKLKFIGRPIDLTRVWLNAISFSSSFSLFSFVH